MGIFEGAFCLGVTWRIDSAAQPLNRAPPKVGTSSWMLHSMGTSNPLEDPQTWFQEVSFPFYPRGPDHIYNHNWSLDIATSLQALTSHPPRPFVMLISFVGNEFETLEKLD